MKNTVLYIIAFVIILPLNAQERPYENLKDSQFYQSLTQGQREKLALIRERSQGMDSSSKASALRKLRRLRRSKGNERVQGESFERFVKEITPEQKEKLRLVREKVSASKKGSE